MFFLDTVALPNRFILAPLAGYTDLPFRMICRSFGAGLCVSEMISCHGLVYQQDKTIRMLDSCHEDRPLAYQLFGSDPAVMGEAAQILNEYRPDFIDINMGCPVKKVTKRGAGAALMADLGNAEQVIRAVVAQSASPVTIKIRTGTDHHNLNGLRLAKIAEENGVCGISVHGRTWKQGYSGIADWDLIATIKNSLSIPVIGNGDISSHEEAVNRLKTSGCDGIMIGRASLGNPWIFDPKRKPANAQMVSQVALKHLAFVEQFSDNPSRKLAPMKNHLGKYFKGFPGSISLRRKVYEATGWRELKQLLKDVEQGRSDGN